MSQASNEADEEFQIVDRTQNNKVRKHGSPQTDVEGAVPRLEGLIKGSLKNMRKAKAQLNTLHDFDELRNSQARAVVDKLDKFRDTLLTLENDIQDTDAKLVRKIRRLNPK